MDVIWHCDTLTNQNPKWLGKDWCLARLTLDCTETWSFDYFSYPGSVEFSSLFHSRLPNTQPFDVTKFVKVS